MIEQSYVEGLGASRIPSRYSLKGSDSNRERAVFPRRPFHRVDRLSVISPRQPVHGVTAHPPIAEAHTLE